MTFLKETLKKSEMVYQGRVFDVKRDTVEVVNSSREHYREVVIHHGGVVVAPILENGDFVMIKQWRYSIDNIIVEFPAGKLAVGEDPFDAIKRELKEETGYEAKNWEYLTYIYPAPGFCTEKLHLYKATNLVKGEQNLDEGESLQPFVISPSELWELVDRGKINDGKTLALLALVGGKAL